MNRSWSGNGVILLAAVCLSCSSAAPPRSNFVQAVDVLSDETLGIDDVIDVRVIGEADMSGSFRIGVDGSTDLPYIGRLEVAGLRPGELQQLIVKKLKDGFLVAPQVTLMVKEWNSRKISVLGQVNHPGPISYFPKMTIMDAIAAAGGFTAVAAQNSVKLRRDINGKPESGTFRVGDISEGRQPNVVLLPRDVLFIEERIF
jgi:protein involved in polysaccharide export with SLBB domain